MQKSKKAAKSTTRKKTTKESASKTGSAKKKTSSSGSGRKTVTEKAEAEPESAAERIDQAIAQLDDWRGERLAEIRKLIHEVDPEVVEEWKWKGTPVWSHEGMYALANAHKKKVKLTFFHGAQLPDPKKLFNAGLEGNKWRAIDLAEGDRIDRPALEALLREAVAYNTIHSVPKSKGSRDGTPGTAKTKSGRSADEAERADSRKRAAGKGGGKPRLLSGGNPQIPKGDGDAPVQAYIAAMPGWKRDVGLRLDALIERAVPDVQKAVRWNSPFYGREGQGWFLSYHCFTKYVKVTFFQGASLTPPPPGRSKHEDVRYLDVHEGQALDEPLVTSWIRQASERPGWIP